MVYTYFLPFSFVSRSLTHENHNILVHFDLVLHSIEKAFFQVVSDEQIELLFSKTPKQSSMKMVVKTEESFSYYPLVLILHINNCNYLMFLS